MLVCETFTHQLNLIALRVAGPSSYNLKSLPICFSEVSLNIVTDVTSGETLRVLDNCLIWTRRSLDCDTNFLQTAKPPVVCEDGVLVFVHLILGVSETVLFI